MAPKWTAERDQNLLLLIISEVKVDFTNLAEKWALKFPDESFHPTAKAVSEHVAALKRKIGGTAGGTTVVVRGTPNTKPKVTSTIPKTPTSRGKRARAEMESSMSNEDDSEEEKAMDVDSPPPKRTTPSRHRVARRYKEEDTSSENEDLLVMSSTKPATTNGTNHSPGDAEGVRTSIARSKTGPPNMGSFRDSEGEDGEGDVSDFEPLM